MKQVRKQRGSPGRFDPAARAEFTVMPEMARMQERLLREHIRHCLADSPFYKRRLRGLGIVPGRVRLSDLPSLPLTDKAEFAARNDAFLAVSQDKIVDIVLSSGTTGMPTRIMYTERDLKRLAYNEHLSMAGCGIGSRDRVLLTCTMDRCFIAGLAYFLGLRSLGAAVIRNGHGTMESHQEIILRMKPTAIIGVPSFLRKLGYFIAANGQRPAGASVRKLVCIGEPLRGSDMALLRLGEDLQDLWNARVYSTYASSETVTTFCECTAQMGGHLHPDLGILEIVDEEGRVLPSGQTGEVVVTPLDTEGMPLLRFKTGDVSFMIEGRCRCGRTSPRLGPVLGRKNQMMKVRGTSIYPQAIYSALDEIPAVSEYYVVVTSEDRLSDEVAVHAAVRDPACTAAELAKKLQSRLRVKPHVVLEPEDAVRQAVFTVRARKPVRFFDRRRSV